MSATNDENEMREIIRFAGHNFLIRIDGQELLALISTIQLACKHPSFHGPQRVLVEAFAEHLRALAKKEAPELDLLQNVLELGWHPDLEAPRAGEMRLQAEIKPNQIEFETPPVPPEPLRRGEGPSPRESQNPDR